MRLQQKLIKHRYGELNLKAPTKYDLDDYGLKTTRLRKPVPDLFDDIIYQLRNPPKRDRYYNHYIVIIEMYMEYLHNATKQSRWQSMAQLIDIHLCGKLIYMEDHPSQFHEFPKFKFTWMYDLLCAMRTYIIGRKYLLREINTNNSISTWTHGFVPWPKPMGEAAMSYLADNIYDLVMFRCDFIRDKSTL